MSLGVPRVTVVIATYNRSNVLAHALASLRAQTLADWEAWVVGDACTDDTATMVAALADARIRFHNLPSNCGDQSGPNSWGMAQARGPFVALLNHDDLWLPEHLATLLALVDDGGDIALAGALWMPGLTQHTCDRGLRFHPREHSPASCWLLRREWYERIGPWRHRRELYNIPSQDWLFRAWRRGAKIRSSALPTVLIVSSLSQAGCYAERQEHVQAALLQQLLAEPQLGQRLLAELRARPRPAATLAGPGTSVWTRRRSLRSLWNTLRFVLRDRPRRFFERHCHHIGISPIAANLYFESGGRKAWVFRLLFEKRGLPDPDRAA